MSVAILREQIIKGEVDSLMARKRPAINARSFEHIIYVHTERERERDPMRARVTASAVHCGSRSEDLVVRSVAVYIDTTLLTAHRGHVSKHELLQNKILSVRERARLRQTR